MSLKRKVAVAAVWVAAALVMTAIALGRLPQGIMAAPQFPCGVITGFTLTRIITGRRQS
jgi:hypothetical protein